MRTIKKGDTHYQAYISRNSDGSRGISMDKGTVESAGPTRIRIRLCGALEDFQPGEVHLTRKEALESLRTSCRMKADNYKRAYEDYLTDTVFLNEVIAGEK